MKPSLLKILSWTAVLLAVLECVLILLSWILSVMMVDGVHSLISGEGLRWLFGRFSDSLLTPCLSWLILLSMGWGGVEKSGLLSSKTVYRQKSALRLSLLFAACYIFFVVLLSCLPHAVLLSATGHLLPSPLSASIVPIVALGLVATSSVYGLFSGTFSSVSDVFSALAYGISRCSSILVLYVFSAQLYASILFVMS